MRRPASLAKFYRRLLGWQVEKAPGIDYWRVDTAPGEAKGIGGGLMFRPIPAPRSWVHYLHVPSLEQTVARIIELGGVVVRAKAAVPKTAWYAVVADPEGNIFAVWQAIRWRCPCRDQKTDDLDLNPHSLPWGP
jgi:predicted enzyme related to lactoylglutathione lyase